MNTQTWQENGFSKGDVTMSLDNFDLLLDAINQVRLSVDKLVDAQVRQCAICDQRFVRLEATTATLIKRLAITATVVVGIAMLHNVDVSGLIAGI